MFLSASRQTVSAATVLPALSTGLVAGVFFAFSNFVMQALERLSVPQRIAAMQSVNITVINPMFMVIFLGTAACCVFLAIFSLGSCGQPFARYLLAGSLLYLAGAMLTTAVCNVPLNDTLARADPTGAHAASIWAAFLKSWLLWNHVRMAAALLGGIDI